MLPFREGVLICTVTVSALNAGAMRLCRPGLTRAVTPSLLIDARSSVDRTQRFGVEGVCLVVSLRCMPNDQRGCDRNFHAIIAYD